MPVPAALPSRRHIAAALACLLPAGRAGAADVRHVTVYKTPWCGCCKGWITHLVRAGFVVRTLEVDDLEPVRLKHGVPIRLSSCHTAQVGPYLLEGHVPIADIQRLLRERPKAIGLAVPGMPIGSPGMESRDGAVESFQTLLLLDRKGSTRVFARHG